MGSPLKRSKTPAPAAPPETISVVVADDHALTRELLVKMLSEQANCCKVVGQAGTALEALEICGRLKPTLLILDVAMPGLNGLQAIPKVKALAPSTRILVWTGEVTTESVTQALAAGANGVIEKTANQNDFLEAIRHVRNGETYLCQRSVQILAASHRQTPSLPSSKPATMLTPRERQILTLIASGFSSKEVASRLFISVATVDTHRANLMGKIHARNVAQLIRYAMDHDLLLAEKKL